MKKKKREEKVGPWRREGKNINKRRSPATQLAAFSRSSPFFWPDFFVLLLLGLFFLLPLRTPPSADCARYSN